MKIALKALAAASMLAAAAPVFAAAYGSATFGNVTVTLIDLDPNDGIAASITFLPDPAKFAGGANIGGVAQTGEAFGSEPGNTYDSFAKTGAWSQSNVSGTVHNALATSSVSVTGAANGAGFSAASLSGSALSSASQGAYFYGEAYIPDISTHNRYFTLSANTEVVFSVDASMSVNTTIGHTSGGLGGESASALLSLYAAGPAADGVTPLEDLAQQGVNVAWVDGDAAGGSAASWSGVISASYSNLSSQSSQGEFGAQAQIRGVSVIAAVPEPTSLGMLVGGLGLMAGLARRSRSRSRSRARAD